MSKKRYNRVCKVCKDPFVAKKSDAVFCSGKCRARYSRENKDSNYQETIKAQSRTIRSQVKVMTAMIPDPVKVEQVSNRVGKDLTECKRPDGSHLYTETDLWILCARIGQLVFASDAGNLLSVLDTDRRSQELIWDFERRFKCRFSDVKSSNPRIKPGRTDVENTELIVKYASLQYSR